MQVHSTLYHAATYVTCSLCIPSLHFIKVLTLFRQMPCRRHCQLLSMYTPHSIIQLCLLYYRFRPIPYATSTNCSLCVESPVIKKAWQSYCKFILPHAMPPAVSLALYVHYHLALYKFALCIISSFHQMPYATTIYVWYHLMLKVLDGHIVTLFYTLLL